MLFFYFSVRICINYEIETFLLVSCSNRSKHPLCFVHGQGQKRNKNIEQRTLSQFTTISLHNHYFNEVSNTCSNNFPIAIIIAPNFRFVIYKPPFCTHQILITAKINFENLMSPKNFLSLGIFLKKAIMEK